MYTIVTYNSSYYNQWNAFVEASKNGTFLFHRDFMEYHADRFQDYSLLVFEGEKLLALLPANRVGDEVHSHGGLTYGGLVFPFNIPEVTIKNIYHAILFYLYKAGISFLKLKQIPELYYKGTVRYEGLALPGSIKMSADTGYAIDFSMPPSISASKLNRFRWASKIGLEMVCDNDFDLFWNDVLKPRLAAKYNSAPVHTSVEINHLHGKFPDKILQYNVYYEGDIVAGVTIFDCGDVVKSQYGATTLEGEKLRALDYAYITLIKKYKATKRYFDLGTVKPDNAGLAKQKKELGGLAYVQDFYEVESSNYKLPDDVLF